MNPIFAAVMQAFMRVQRKCPKCGKGQFVSANKKGEKVKCKACGAEIPPPKSGSSGGVS